MDKINRTTITVEFDEADENIQTVTITGPDVIRSLNHIVNQGEGAIESLIIGPADAFRRMGYTSGIVEQWMQQHPEMRQDDDNTMYDLIVAHEVLAALDEHLEWPEEEES